MRQNLLQAHNMVWPIFIAFGLSSMRSETMSETVHLPTRSQVINQLTKLVDGRISREDASSWASPWVVRLEDIEDDRVCQALVHIAGADTPATDDTYLYMKEDFEDWLRELTA